MLHSVMKNSSLKNYIQVSPKRRIYSFRRRIPEKLKDHFIKEDGSSRGNEWNESLKTKSISVALRNAVIVNERFERTKAMAKEMRGVIKSDSDKTQQEGWANVSEHYRRLGLHPDQAPSVLASDNEKAAHLKRVEDEYWQLSDIQAEGGIEESVSWDPENVTYASNKLYDDIQVQLDFLRGDQTTIRNRLKVTWEIALDEYIKTKARTAGDQDNFHKTKPIKRTIRIANSFAKMLGNGSVQLGSDRFLTDISRQDARRWIDDQMKSRTGATVGREVTTLAAIFSRAITEYKGTDPDLLSLGNPFSRLRTEVQKIDDEAVRRGLRVQINARAWTSQELKSLRERLPLMNDEARLCAKLAIYTGARLSDISGLLVQDLVLNGKEDSKILFRHNAFRKLSKDSIERTFPLYGEMLQDLKDYLSNIDLSLDQKLTPRYARNTNSVGSLSALLNQKHIDEFSTDPSLKMHGMRNTLQAKFDAASFANKVSGYLIGWKNQETIGMQKEYKKQGYPQAQMLKALRAAHSVKEWATQVPDT